MYYSKKDAAIKFETRKACGKENIHEMRFYCSMSGDNVLRWRLPPTNLDSNSFQKKVSSLNKKLRFRHPKHFISYLYEQLDQIPYKKFENVKCCSLLINYENQILTLKNRLVQNLVYLKIKQVNWIVKLDTDH